MTALHWAAFQNDTETAQLLIAAGANVKAATRIGGITPLSLACTNGNAALIEALLRCRRRRQRCQRRRRHGADDRGAFRGRTCGHCAGETRSGRQRQRSGLRADRVDVRGGKNRAAAIHALLDLGAPIRRSRATSGSSKGRVWMRTAIRFRRPARAPAVDAAGAAEGPADAPAAGLADLPAGLPRQSPAA